MAMCSTLYEGKNAYKILTRKFYDLDENDRMSTRIYVEYINQFPCDISTFLGLLVILVTFGIR